MRRRLRHHGPGHDQFEIDEVGAFAAQEILVGQVAPAGNRHRAVGHEELVVHAVVEPAKVGEELDPPRGGVVAGVHERVEQADLGIGLRGKSEQQAVHAGGIKIVEQQAHPYAATGGIAHFAQQQAAGLVVAELVGLHVQRGLRLTHQLETGVERKRGLDQRADAGKPVLLRCAQVCSSPA
jgi:hypothetical protein